MKTLIGPAFLILLCATGCRVGPHYTSPCVEIPDEWKTTETSEDSSVPPAPCITYWWEVFDDETLNALEEQAIESNPTLYMALQRVYEARATTTVAGAGLYPQLALNPTYSNTGELFKIYVPQGLFPMVNPTDSIYRIHQMQYTLPLTMSYELDLWGKVRGQYESALFHAQAEADAYHVAMLTLTTDLASAYYQLKLFETQLALLEGALKIRQQLYDQTHIR